MTDTLDGVIVLVVIFLLIAGFVIDLLIIMLIPDLPTTYPELNGDPVRFGMVLHSCDDRKFTPPVGAAMYAVCLILRCPIGDYTRESFHSSSRSRW